MVKVTNLKILKNVSFRDMILSSKFTFNIALLAKIIKEKTLYLKYNIVLYNNNYLITIMYV